LLFHFPRPALRFSGSFPRPPFSFGTLSSPRFLNVPPLRIRRQICLVRRCGIDPPRLGICGVICFSRLPCGFFLRCTFRFRLPSCLLLLTQRCYHLAPLRDQGIGLLRCQIARHCKALPPLPLSERRTGTRSKQSIRNAGWIV